MKTQEKQSIYSQAIITIYNKLAWQPDDAEFELGLAFMSCFDLVAPGETRPLIFAREFMDSPMSEYIPTTITVRCYITQPDTDAPLEQFEIDLLFESDSDIGREYTAYLMQQMRRSDDEEPEDERETDAELMDTIQEIHTVGNKRRISIIECNVISTEQEPPPENMVLPGILEMSDGSKEFEVATVPLTTVQAVLDRFLWFRLVGATMVRDQSASRLLRNPKTHFAFNGDRRWIAQGGELDQFVKFLDIVRGVAV